MVTNAEMMQWGGRKIFGKMFGFMFPFISKSISKQTREWMVTNVAELKKEALKTETDSDDAAVVLIEGIFNLSTGGPIESAISPEFKIALSAFLDNLQEKTQTTPNDIDDVAAEMLRGVFNIHQES